MPANALVQTRIDADIRDRASAVLESMGLTVSDAVRILLTRTANEGALPLDSSRTAPLMTPGFGRRCGKPGRTTEPTSPMIRSRRVSRSAAPPPGR